MKRQIQSSLPEAVSHNWDDFRFFLATVEYSSFAAAARKLSVSKPTVRRRVNQLEERLGVILFTQHPDGQTITPAGETLAASVARVRGEVERLQRRSMQFCLGSNSIYNLTTTEDLAECWVAESVTAFLKAHPEIRINILAGNKQLDLLRNQAQIAIRIGNPRSSSLVGRCLGKIEFGLYASECYLESHGVLIELEQLTEHKLIGFMQCNLSLMVAPQMADLLERCSKESGSNNINVQYTLARHGAGIVCLPLYMEKNPFRKQAGESTRWYF